MHNYKVAYYIRVSKGEQAKGYSFEGQKSTLDDWVKDNEWKWVKTYYDEASEKDTNRERFQEMITDAKHGLFDGICIVDSDRFSRSAKDLLNIMDDLLVHKVKLYIHNLKHIDIYSKQGRFTLTNLAAFSEFFRGQLAAKIRAGVKQKMKNEWFGQAPYGYMIKSDDIDGQKKNTRLEKNPEEQKILVKMKKLRENGKSYNEIAEILNKEGIVTRYTKKDRKSDWHSSTVRNILMRSKIKINNLDES
jgi:DNA invertase Pin-like site-specific DNA recombinase